MNHLRKVPNEAPRNIGAEDLLSERMTQVGAMLQVLSLSFSAEIAEKPEDHIVRGALWGIQALHEQAEVAREAALNRD